MKRTIFGWLLILALAASAAISICGCDPGNGETQDDVAAATDTTVYCDDSDPCGASNYMEELPEGELLYVNACCSAGTPDGSIESPYSTIGEALELAGEGGIVVVAAGLYCESVAVVGSVKLLGAGVERTTIASSAKDQPDMVVRGASDVEIAGFALEGEGETGLYMEDSQGIRASNIRSSGHQGPEDCGKGVYVKDSNDVVLEDMELIENARYGILAVDSSGRISGCHFKENGGGPQSAAVAVSSGSDWVVGSTEASFPGDLEKGGCVVEQTNGLGFAASDSRVVVAGLLFDGNAYGGLALLGCGIKDDPALVENNEFRSSVGLGIDLRGGHAVVSDNKIDEVLDCKEATCQANCVNVIGSPGNLTVVDLVDNEISGCSRSGVLLHGEVTAVVLGNALSSVEFSCVWAQEGAEIVTLGDNKLLGCQFAGIGVALNARAHIDGNEVSSTSWGTHKHFKTGVETEMADGIVVTKIGVPDGVLIENNTVHSSERLGIVVDNCTHTNVAFGSGNTVVGNVEAGIALQNGAEGIADVQDLGTLVVFTAEGQKPNAGLGDVAAGTKFDVLNKLDEPDGAAMCLPPECTD